MGLFNFLFKKKTTLSCPHSAPYVILDVETTGLNPAIDKVIQLSAIKYDTDGLPIDSYDTFLNPGIHIPKPRKSTELQTAWYQMPHALEMSEKRSLTFSETAFWLGTIRYLI